MPSHNITVKIAGTARCPECDCLRVVIDRFDHSKFMVCKVCNMRYKVIAVTPPGATVPEYIPGEGKNA